MPTTEPVYDIHAYNGIAVLYDRYWRNISIKLMPALDRLVLAALPPGSRVLDLCCGAGHVAAAIQRRFAVTGIDSSENMIRLAGKNAPGATFVVQDARRFSLPVRFDAVVSTGDSMNHMLSSAELSAVFGRVQAALVSGGVFVFDMNMARAFETEWHKSSTVVAPDHLLYVRGRYDTSSRLGTTEITVFKMGETWNRSDSRMLQRCYAQREVRALLVEAGFRRVRAYSASSLGIQGRLAMGRTFFVGRT